MGRQEQPLDACEGPLALFALDLRELRRQAGSPPYRRLATRINYSASTLAEAAAGHRLPSQAVLAAFVAACGGDPVEWERRRVDTHREITSPQGAGQMVGVAAETDTDTAAVAETVTVTEHVAGAAVVARDAPAPAPDVASAPSRVPPVGSPALPSRPGRSASPRRLLAPLIAVVLAIVFSACVPGDSAAPRASSALTAPAAPSPRQDTARWLRPDTGIPPQYRDLIIEAGRTCPEPEVTPPLIAAILEAESGFDPNLNDPAKDEYGIARWTPRVLRYYLPADRQNAVPVPPFTPEESIPALGRMLCAVTADLQGVPGDPLLNLAAAYRTATWVVQERDQARLAAIQPYLDRVRGDLQRYHPAQPTS
ncbi:helix-turn-helix domain-containing protein [Kitasatospora sp. NPDC089509]|uniref:helix-turn-helix domain-containing protein n=1 Tax=Kitasatospora sp. NPDC089509 TaxID=3364079 RepID=UPI00380FE807